MISSRIFFSVGGLHRVPDVQRQHVQQGVEVVGNAFLIHRMFVPGDKVSRGIPRATQGKGKRDTCAACCLCSAAYGISGMR